MSVACGGRTVFWLTVLSFVLACGCSGGAAPQSGAPPTPEVVVGKPIKKKLVEWDEYTGRLEAVDFVEVRSRVSGYLVQASFNEGQIVQQGDLLLVIDPRPYQAAVKRSEADFAEAKANVEKLRAELLQAQARQRASQARLELADKQLKRVETLLPTRAVSQDEYDVQAAQRTETLAQYESSGADVEAASAAIASAEAAVETADAILAQARLELEYTEIRAPITGRISRKFITVGNYVTGGVENSAALTTIASTDPMHSYFDADEQSFLKYARLSREGTRVSSREVKNPVYMALSDEKQGFPHRGYMDFVDNRLDPNTGSMRGRAIFPNRDGALTPGLFVRLRLPGSGEYEATLIPDRALGVDQSETYVYVLGAENKLERRTVTLGPPRFGLRIIRTGLKGDEQVVLRGLQRIRPGITVKPTTEELKLDERDELPTEYKALPLEN